jgi:hypothetical protein
VTRLFEARDAMRLRRLQSKSVSLEIESDVLSRESPFRRAMGSCWPIGTRKTVTVVDRPDAGTPEGFLQARWRRDFAEADVSCLAPALDGPSGAALTWQRILANGCSALGSGGAERVYAAVSEDDQVALQVFRQIGFVPFTTDVTFYLPAGTASPTPIDGAVAEGPLHRQSISRLYQEGSPESVQQHEDPSGTAWLGYPLGGWLRPLPVPSVLLGPRGDVRAAWRAYRGPAGVWIHFVTGSDVDADAAVSAALAALGPHVTSSLPVYSAAKGHESRLNLALREAGFEPLGRRFRLVKHMTVRVLEPAWSPGVIRDGRLEATNPAPTFQAPAQSSRTARSSGPPARSAA